MLILSILTGQAKTQFLRAVPCLFILTVMMVSQGVLKHKFLCAAYPSCHPTNSIKAMKAKLAFEQAGWFIHGTGGRRIFVMFREPWVTGQGSALI